MKSTNPKIIAIALSGILLFGTLTGCSSKAQADTNKAPSASQQTQTQTQTEKPVEVIQTATFDDIFSKPE